MAKDINEILAMGSPVANDQSPGSPWMPGSSVSDAGLEDGQDIVISKDGKLLRVKYNKATNKYQHEEESWEPMQPRLMGMGHSSPAMPAMSKRINSIDPSEVEAFATGNSALEQFGTSAARAAPSAIAGAGGFMLGMEAGAPFVGVPVVGPAIPFVTGIAGSMLAAGGTQATLDAAGWLQPGDSEREAINQLTNPNATIAGNFAPVLASFRPSYSIFKQAAGLEGAMAQKAALGTMAKGGLLNEAIATGSNAGHALVHGASNTDRLHAVGRALIPGGDIEKEWGGYADTPGEQAGSIAREFALGAFGLHKPWAAGVPFHNLAAKIGGRPQGMVGFTGAPTWNAKAAQITHTAMAMEAQRAAMEAQRAAEKQSQTEAQRLRTEQEKQDMAGVDVGEARTGVDPITVPLTPAQKTGIDHIKAMLTEARNRKVISEAQHNIAQTVADTMGPEMLKHIEIATIGGGDGSVLGVTRPGRQIDPQATGKQAEALLNTVSVFARAIETGRFADTFIHEISHPAFESLSKGQQRNVFLDMVKERQRARSENKVLDFVLNRMGLTNENGGNTADWNFQAHRFTAEEAGEINDFLDKNGVSTVDKTGREIFAANKDGSFRLNPSFFDGQALNETIWQTKRLYRLESVREFFTEEMAKGILARGKYDVKWGAIKDNNVRNFIMSTYHGMVATLQRVMGKRAAVDHIIDQITKGHFSRVTRSGTGEIAPAEVRTTAAGRKIDITTERTDAQLKTLKEGKGKLQVEDPQAYKTDFGAGLGRIGDILARQEDPKLQAAASVRAGIEAAGDQAAPHPRLSEDDATPGLPRESKAALKKLGIKDTVIGNVVRHSTIGHIESDYPQILSGEHAAHVFRGIAQATQESMQVLVTDKNGNPIEIYRHTMSEPGMSQLSPLVMVSQALGVKGAKKIWIAHNHPSQTYKFSDSDLIAEGSIKRVLEKTGISLAGFLAIAGDKYTHIGKLTGGSENAGMPMPARTGTGGVKIPLIERRFSLPRGGPEDHLSTRHGNDETGQRLLVRELLNDKPGIIFMDRNGMAVGKQEIDIERMKKLGTTGVKNILGAYDRSGATHMIVSVGDSSIQLASRELAAMNVTDMIAQVRGSGKYMGVKAVLTNDGDARSPNTQLTATPGGNRNASWKSEDDTGFDRGEDLTRTAVGKIKPLHRAPDTPFPMVADKLKEFGITAGYLNQFSEHAVVGEVKTGVTEVKTAGDVASLMHDYAGTLAQGQTMILILGENGKPLQVGLHMIDKSQITQTSEVIQPMWGVLAGQAISTPGAKEAWFVRINNDLTSNELGNPTTDAAIENEDSFKNLLEGSKIRYRGVVMMSGRQYSSTEYQDGVQRPGMGRNKFDSNTIKPMPIQMKPATSTIPLTERRYSTRSQIPYEEGEHRFDRTEASENASWGRSEPMVKKKLDDLLGGQPGVMFRTSSGKVAGVYPMTLDEMSNIRNSPAQESLLAMMDRGGVNWGFVTVGDNDHSTVQARKAVSNVNAFLKQMGLKVIDTFGRPKMPIDGDPENVGPHNWKSEDDTVDLSEGLLDMSHQYRPGAGNVPGMEADSSLFKGKNGYVLGTISTDDLAGGKLTGEHGDNVFMQPGRKVSIVLPEGVEFDRYEQGQPKGGYGRAHAGREGGNKLQEIFDKLGMSPDEAIKFITENFKHGFVNPKNPEVIELKLPFAGNYETGPGSGFASMKDPMGLKMIIRVVPGVKDNDGNMIATVQNILPDKYSRQVREFNQKEGVRIRPEQLSASFKPTELSGEHPGDENITQDKSIKQDEYFRTSLKTRPTMVERKGYTEKEGFQKDKDYQMWSEDDSASYNERASKILKDRIVGPEEIKGGFLAWMQNTKEMANTHLTQHPFPGNSGNYDADMARNESRSGQHATIDQVLAKLTKQKGFNPMTLKPGMLKRVISSSQEATLQAFKELVRVAGNVHEFAFDQPPDINVDVEWGHVKKYHASIIKQIQLGMEAGVISKQYGLEITEMANEVRSRTFSALDNYRKKTGGDRENYSEDDAENMRIPGGARDEALKRRPKQPIKTYLNIGHGDVQGEYGNARLMGNFKPEDTFLYTYNHGNGKFDLRNIAEMAKEKGVEAKNADDFAHGMGGNLIENDLRLGRNSTGVSGRIELDHEGKKILVSAGQGRGKLDAWTAGAGNMMKRGDALKEVRDNVERLQKEGKLPKDYTVEGHGFPGPYERDFLGYKPEFQERFSEDDGENMRIPGGARDNFQKASAKVKRQKPIKFWTDVGHADRRDASGEENTYLWYATKDGKVDVISASDLRNSTSPDGYDLFTSDDIPTHADWEEHISAGNIDGRYGKQEISSLPHGRIDDRGDVTRISFLSREGYTGNGEVRPSDYEHNREQLKQKLSEWVYRKTEDVAGYDFSNHNGNPERFSQDDAENMRIPGGARDEALKRRPVSPARISMYYTDIGHPEGRYYKVSPGVEANKDSSQQYLWAFNQHGEFKMISVKDLAEQYEAKRQRGGTNKGGRFLDQYSESDITHGQWAALTGDSYDHRKIGSGRLDIMPDGKIRMSWAAGNEMNDSEARDVKADEIKFEASSFLNGEGKRASKASPEKIQGYVWDSSGSGSEPGRFSEDDAENGRWPNQNRAKGRIPDARVRNGETDLGMILAPGEVLDSKGLRIRKNTVGRLHWGEIGHDEGNWHDTPGVEEAFDSGNLQDGFRDADNSLFAFDSDTGEVESEFAKDYETHLARWADSPGATWGDDNWGKIDSRYSYLGRIEVPVIGKDGTIIRRGRISIAKNSAGESWVDNSSDMSRSDMPSGLLQKIRVEAARQAVSEYKYLDTYGEPMTPEQTAKPDHFDIYGFGMEKEKASMGFSEKDFGPLKLSEDDVETYRDLGRRPVGEGKPGQERLKAIIAKMSEDDTVSEPPFRVPNVTPNKSNMEIAKDIATARFFTGISTKAHEIADGSPGSKTAKAVANLIHARAGAEAGVTGLDLPTSIMKERTKRMNSFFEIMSPLRSEFASLSRADREMAYRDLADMITGELAIDPSTPAGRAAEGLKAMLAEMHGYRTAAGEKIGEVEDYFPAVYDSVRIADDAQAFKADAKRAYMLELANEFQGQELEDAAEKKARELTMSHIRGEGEGQFKSFFEDATPALGENSSKSRKFGKEAQQIMSKWQNKDPYRVISRYIAGATKSAEIVRRLGDEGKKWRKMVAAMEKEGVSYDKIDELRDLLKQSVGIGRRQNGKGEQTFIDLMGLYTAGSVMGRSFMNNMFEPGSMGIRSGNLGLGLLAYAETWGRTLRNGARVLSGERIDKSFWEKYAEEIGTISADVNDAWMNSHSIEVDGDRSDPRINWLTSRVYQSNLLQITENAKLQASHAIGFKYLASLAKMQQGKSWMNALDVGESVRGNLRELGIPDADHSAFSSWMMKLNKLNDARRMKLLTSGSKMSKLFETAITKFSMQSSVRANRAHKPVFQDGAVGKTMFQLMSYSYAYSAEVNSRTYNYAISALKSAPAGKAYTVGDRIRFMAPLMMMPLSIVAFRAMFWAKDELYPTEYSKEHANDPWWMKWLNAASFAGGFGPKVEMATKYVMRDQPPGGPTGQLAVGGARVAKDAISNTLQGKPQDTTKRQALKTSVPAIKAAAVIGATAVHPAAGVIASQAANSTLWSNAMTEKPKKQPKGPKDEYQKEIDKEKRQNKKESK